MATAKSKKASSKAKSSKPKTTSAAKSVKTVKAEEPRVDNTKNNKPMSGFFARKFDATENILTIFKRPNIYGAIIGEVVGTCLLTFVLLALGIYAPLYLAIGIIAITALVFGLSGANLNPLVTASMMATRRMSAIRGVLYMIAQVLGAWIGLLIFTSFLNVSGDVLGSPAEAPAIDALTEKTTGAVICLQLVAALILGFAYNRAQSYKKNPLAFAFIAGGTVALVAVTMYMIAGNYMGLSTQFIANPAVAMMYQIFPTEGEAGEVIKKICETIGIYILVPVVGGILGAYASEAATRLAGEEECECCKK